MAHWNDPQLRPVHFISYAMRNQINDYCGANTVLEAIEILSLLSDAHLINAAHELSANCRLYNQHEAELTAIREAINDEIAHRTSF